MVTKEDELQVFADYCAKFYGTFGIHSQDLKGGFTYDAIKAAAALVMETSNHFEGDSIDREYVRDILLTARRVVRS